MVGSGGSLELSSGPVEDVSGVDEVVGSSSVVPDGVDGVDGEVDVDVDASDVLAAGSVIRSPS